MDMEKETPSKIKQQRKRRCKVGKKRSATAVTKDTALNKIKKQIKHNKPQPKETTKYRGHKKITVNKEISDGLEPMMP